MKKLFRTSSLTVRRLKSKGIITLPRRARQVPYEETIDSETQQYLKKKRSLSQQSSMKVTTSATAKLVYACKLKKREIKLIWRSSLARLKKK